MIFDTACLDSPKKIQSIFLFFFKSYKKTD